MLSHGDKEVGIRSITLNDVNDGSRLGNAVVDDAIRFEDNLIQQNVVIQPGTSSALHLRFFQSTEEARESAEMALRVIETARRIQKKSVNNQINSI